MSNDILRWFNGDHLPSAQARILVAMFLSLAEQIVEETAPGAEQSVALRKLLEAKDAAVRALLLTEEQEAHPLIEVPPSCPHTQWDEMISGGSRVRRCRDCHETFDWSS